MYDLPVLGLRNSLPSETPLTYFPPCLKAFEEDLLKVRIDGHDVYTLFDLKWTKNQNQENVFNFELHLLNMERFDRDESHIFYIECSPIKTRSFFCSTVEKTKVAMKMTKILKGAAEPSKNYGEDTFFGSCEENAAKLLIHYGMITGSVMLDARLDLPPVPAVFPSFKSWTPRKVELSVHQSIISKSFVGQWLAFIPTRAGLELTINSTHYPLSLKEDAKFEEFLCSVSDLTINAKCDIDVRFITKYAYLKTIVYNDPSGVSPLTLEECVKLWGDLINGKRYIVIRLICRHDPSKLEGDLLRALLEPCPEGVYNDETKTITFSPTEQVQNKFSVSENQLVIENHRE